MFGALVVAAAVVILGSILTFVFIRPKQEGERLPVADSLSVDSLVEEVVREFRGGALEQNELFATLLKRLGVSEDTTVLSQAALESTDFDFRRLMPGDSVTLEYVDSALARVIYHIDPVVSYEVRFDSSGAEGMRAWRHVDTATAVIRGAVDGSLWEAMTEAGADPHLVAEYCEVLRSQVEFPRDVEAGDTFGLVVERLTVDGSLYRYGEILAALYRGSSRSGEAYLYRAPTGERFHCDVAGRSLFRLLEYPPVVNARRTSDFGPRMHPFRRRRIKHSGLDYAAPYGAPVRAVANGTVTRRRWTGGYGRTVDVRHEGSNLSSRYAHLCRYDPAAKNGAKLSKGQVLGYVGSTGLSTGFHLDFSLRRNGTPVDPLEVLPSGHRTVPQDYLQGYKARVAEWRKLLRDG